jgi:rubrerythrin
MTENQELTGFEKEFGINLSAKNLDVNRGIDIALKVEKDGFRFFTDNAKKIQNIEIKRFIEFLAGEEMKHIAILKELKVSLKKRQAWVDVAEDPNILNKILEDLRVFKGKAGREIREAGDVTILLNALKIEKDLVEYYEKFAHNVKDSGGKKFFLKLADWERTHYQLLEGIYESITFFRMQS